MYDQLINAYKEGNLILFVGAGISRNMDVPDWNSLIDKIALEMGFDPDEFKSYGTHWDLAEYYRIKTGSIGPLRSWMDREWHSNAKEISSSKIHELIVNSAFNIIYTTNYDRWLEIAFQYYNKPYTKICSVADLTQLKENVTQIIKFHGDFDDDDSIVLDATSYYERLEFETPLDIKLRSDLLGKSVLFIGYGLSDINLRILFYKLTKLWQKNSYATTQPKSYIFMHKPNPVQKLVFEQWGISVITPEEESDSPKEATEKFLTKLNKKLS